MIFAEYFAADGSPAQGTRTHKIINDTLPVAEQHAEARLFGKRHGHHSFVMQEGTSFTDCIPLTHMMEVKE